jgi:small-conductance mechanosensitive channel
MSNTPTPPAGPRSKLGDTIFAVAHVLALIAVLIYGIIGLAQRNTARFAVVIAGLVLYYVLVLHKAMVKEIHRKRGRKME